MKQEVKQDQADYTILILVRDDSGNAKTGLAFGDIDLAYARVETDNDVTTTDVAPANLAGPALTDPHLDWGFLEVSAGDHPGLYRLDIADAVFASGAWSAVVSLVGAGLEPSHCEFVLVPSLPYDGVALNSAQGATTFATFSVTGQLDAGSVLIDAGMDIVGAFSVNSLLVDTTTTLSGNVSLGGTLGVTGISTFTGAVNAAITGNITGNLSGTVAGKTPAEVGDIEGEVDKAFENAMPANPTADSLNERILFTKYSIANKMVVTEANGNTIIYKDDGIAEHANVAAAFDSAAGVTTRKKLE